MTAALLTIDAPDVRFPWATLTIDPAHSSIEFLKAALVDDRRFGDGIGGAVSFTFRRYLAAGRTNAFYAAEKVRC